MKVVGISLLESIARESLENAVELNTRILIIDDYDAIHEDFRKALNTVLTETQLRVMDLEASLFGSEAQTTPLFQHNYQIESAFQGEEGYLKVKAACEKGEPYAMVFLDVRMPPGWDGIRTGKEILELDKEIQIVLCSAYSDYSWESILTQMGETDRLLFLRKPFDSMEVKQFALALTRKWAMERASKESTAQLQVARRLAESASREKSDFLSNMSHEIRTPLNGVIGMAELLRQTALNEDQMDLVHSVSQCASVLLDLVNDILDFSKIEAGKMTLERMNFNLPAAISDICSVFTHRLRDSNLILRVNIMPSVAPVVVADPTRIRQILLNFLSNAIKFTENGGIRIEVSQLEREGNRCLIRFAVEDTGIGISADGMSKLFKPFSQVDSSTTRKYGGTGLGLIISKKLANLMGGTIGAESEVGRGSIFWFTAWVEALETSTVALSLPNIGSMRLLGLSAGQFLSPALLLELNEQGHELEWVNSGSDALARINENLNRPFDALVIQGSLPRLEGWPELHSLTFKKKVPKSSPVVVLFHTEPHPGDALRAEELGVEVYLTSPVDGFELIGSIRQAIAARERTLQERSKQIITKHRFREEFCKQNRILVVEDNRINQKVAVQMLRTLGLEAVVAENGKDALDVMEKETFQLILMDCQMPIMDGYETSRRIRDMENEQEAHRIPIIALTANAVAGDRERCIEAGMDDYLAKPIRLEALRSILEQWLANRVNMGAVS